jgi:hypothetical protein
MLYTSPWSGFELTTLMMIGTDCNYHTITTMTAPEVNFIYHSLVEADIRVWVWYIVTWGRGWHQGVGVIYKVTWGRGWHQGVGVIYKITWGRGTIYHTHTLMSASTSGYFIYHTHTLMSTSSSGNFMSYLDIDIYISLLYRVWVVVFNATFNNISFISWRSVLLVEETGVLGEKHRLAASHWQTWS